VKLRLLIACALVATLVVVVVPGRADTSSVSAKAIAAGLAHTCALTSAGGVKCWGSNDHDELGNGTRADSATPVDVSGLTRGVAAIAAGVRHHCALTRRGGVKCWGHSSFGTLGDGTNVRRFTPVDVAGLAGDVTAIAAGHDHSCALTSAGGVKCWGYNRFGAVGDGTTIDRWAAVDVVGLTSGVTAIAAGFGQSCALTTAGGVKCWGSVSGGRSAPVDVPGLSGVSAIATSGSHSCAVTTAGGVKCWGRNNAGQLGDGSLDDSATPVDVVGLRSGVTAIATGTARSCALTRTGGVRCWGLNDHGQVGDGTTRNRSTPVDVSGLRSGVTAIAAGSFHGCARTRTGGLRCWGLNGAGQLGDGTTAERRTPVAVVGVGAAALLRVVSRSVTVTPARVAAISLRCGAQARCRGTLTLTAAVAGKLVGSPAGRVRMTLGSTAFSIPAGGSRAVGVRLRARAFALLVRVKRLSATARVAAPATARTITLVAPTRKPGR
jgi:alpha-tubulin suppressor-like RCC1 family protein